MVLYEYVGICRGEISKASFASFLRNICLSIMNGGGVVRNIEHLGCDLLPYPMKHANSRVFYGSPSVIHDLRKKVKSHPDTLRANIVCNGRSLKHQTLTEIYQRKGMPTPINAVVLEACEKLNINPEYMGFSAPDPAAAEKASEAGSSEFKGLFDGLLASHNKEQNEGEGVNSNVPAARQPEQTKKTPLRAGTRRKLMLAEMLEQVPQLNMNQQDFGGWRQYWIEDMRKIQAKVKELEGKLKELEQIRYKNQPPVTNSEYQKQNDMDNYVLEKEIERIKISLHNEPAKEPENTYMNG